MTLDPQVQKLLESLKGRKVKPIEERTAEEYRGQINFYKAMLGTPKEVANIEDRMIPVENGEIPIRIYTPKGKGPFPVFIYLHGGGFVIGDIDVGNTVCCNIANGSNCIVVSVGYRLAPEHKFPVALQDSIKATKWVADNANSINADSSRIAIGGDSAGGNMATVISSLSRKEGYPSIKYQVLIYPMTNMDFDTKSYRENGEGYILTRESAMWFVRQYLNDEEEKNNPLVAPMLAENLEGLPPALIITAQYDPLRDDGSLYASKLIEHGVDVEYKCYKGMIHGFLWMTEIIKQGEQAIDHIANRLSSVFNNTEETHANN